MHRLGCARTLRPARGRARRGSASRGPWATTTAWAAVTDTASAWQLADTLGLPALLVVRPKGASLTLAAELQRADSVPHTAAIIAGILLNDCSASFVHTAEAPMLEKETGLPVVGCLPPLPEACHREPPPRSENRRGDRRSAAQDTALVRCRAANHRLADCCTPCLTAPRPPLRRARCPRRGVRIAVARDAAFCFTYAETLEALRENGAELCFFSPLARHGSAADNIGGLYLPGGYPELYAARLGRERRHARRRKKRRAGRSAHRGRVRRLPLPGPER